MKNDNEKIFVLFVLAVLALLVMFLTSRDWGPKTMIIEKAEAQEPDPDRFCGLKVVVCPGEEYTPPTPAYTEEELIIQEIKRTFPEDSVTAIAVAIGESRLDPQNNYLNPGGSAPGSIDRGLYMINDYWHPTISDTCAYDWRCNLKEARKIYDDRKRITGNGWEAWYAYEGHNWENNLIKAKKLNKIK
jgi:hypothetical protein